MSDNRCISFLIVDDDADDRLLIEDAFVECAWTISGTMSPMVLEMLQFLRAENGWADRDASRLPSLILLDLNMPRMDGRTALAHLKKDPVLRRIPVIILTTSLADEDMLRAYDLGATSFILKPVTFDAIMNVVQVLDGYWAQHVQLPNAPSEGRAA